MNVPRVSVLLPTYNRAAYVGQAIKSALDQTYADLEVVVVDDGSTDNTVEMVRSFTDGRVRFIRQDNKGISGALNTAFRASRGRYVAILNSDDLWLPELLEEEVPVLEANPDIGLVYARAQAMDTLGRPLGQVLGAPEKYRGQTFASLLYGDHVCGVTAAFRRELAEQVGLWDESLVANEDWDMWLRLSLVCRFRFVDRVLARFRIHPGNITGASHRFVQLSLDRVRILDKVFSRHDLPPGSLSMKPLAYRNVYVDVGLRWLSVGKWRDALRYFGMALQVSPCPLMTPARIFYLIVFYNFLSKRTWGTALVNTLVDLRRKYGT